MGIGETFEVLGTGLEEGALGIQHFEETELPELEALGGRVVGAASAGQNLLLERLNVREQRLQPLLVLGCIGAQAQFRSTQFVRALSARRSASSRLPWLRSKTGNGIDSPTMA